MRQSLNASDNAAHVREAIPLGRALRLALVQAISLTDLLRPHGRLSPPPSTSRGLASDRKSGYQSGYETRVLSRTPIEINRIEPICC